MELPPADFFELVEQIQRWSGIAELWLMLALGGLLLTAFIRPNSEENTDRHAATLLCVFTLGTALRVLPLWISAVPFSVEAIPGIEKIDSLLQNGTWLERLTVLPGLTQRFSFVSVSLTAFPVFSLLLVAVGPIAANVLFGTLCSLLTTVAAYFFMRWTFGRDHALVVAVLLYASPVQILWSYVRGLYLTGPAHTFVALACLAYLRRRKTLTSALAAAVVVFTSVYSHYLALLSWPLALLFAIQLGLRPEGRNYMLGSVAFLLPFGLLLALVTAGYLAWPWPEYGSPKTIAEALKSGFLPFLSLALRGTADALSVYFLNYRGLLHPDSYVAFGAIPLVLLPCVLLGLLKQRAIWPHVALCSLLILSLTPAVLSFAELRKLLVFDAAVYCLAAHGIASSRLRTLLADLPSTLMLVILSMFLSGAMIARDGTTQQVRNLHNALYGEGIAAASGDPLQLSVWMPEFKNTLSDNQLIIFDATPVVANAVYETLKLTALDVDRRQHHIHIQPLLKDHALWTSEDAFADDPESWLAYRLTQTAPSSAAWFVAADDLLSKRFTQYLISLGGQAEAFVIGREGQTASKVVFPPSLFPSLPELLTQLQTSTARRLSPGDIKVEFPSLRLEQRHYVPELENFRARVRDMLGGSTRLSIPHNVLGVSLQRKQTDDYWLVLDGHGFSYRLYADGRSERRKALSLFHRTVNAACVAPVGEAWVFVNPYDGSIRGETDLSWLPPHLWVSVAEADDDTLLLTEFSGKVFAANVTQKTLRPVGTAELWHGKGISAPGCPTVFMHNGKPASYNTLSTELVFYRKGEQRALNVASSLGLARINIDAVWSAGEDFLVRTREHSQLVKLRLTDQ